MGCRGSAPESIDPMVERGAAVVSAGAPVWEAALSAVSVATGAAASWLSAVDASADAVAEASPAPASVAASSVAGASSVAASSSPDLAATAAGAADTAATASAEASTALSQGAAAPVATDAADNAVAQTDAPAETTAAPRSTIGSIDSGAEPLQPIADDQQLAAYAAAPPAADDAQAVAPCGPANNDNTNLDNLGNVSYQSTPAVVIRDRTSGQVDVYALDGCRLLTTLQT